MAAAFKATLVATSAKTGESRQFSYTCSDVNGEFFLIASGSSDVILNGSNDVYITDLSLSAAGTDCSNSTIYIGGMDSGIRLLHAANLGTIVNRPFQMSPLRVPGGQVLKIKMNT